MWLLSQIAVVIVTSLNDIRLLEFRIYFVQFQIVHFRRDVHIIFLYMIELSATWLLLFALFSYLLVFPSYLS